MASGANSVGAVRSSLPRFRRVGIAAPLRLTDDDIAILRHINRHRFLRTTDLYRLMADRSPDRLSRRLACLYRAEYLDRPLSQIDRFRGGGSQPLVYGLDNRGAAHLAAIDGAKAPKGTLRSRNRAFTRDNLDHTLATAAFMIDMELACRATGGVEFVPPEAVLCGRAARWTVSLPWRGYRADVQIAPDAVFGLRLSQDGASLRSFYFVETDTGCMTITPSEHVRRSEALLYRSSILRKLLAYAMSHHEGAHQGHLGIPAARVLFVTTNAARAEEMRRAAERFVLPHVGIPSGMLLFAATGDTIDPFTSILLTVEGAAVSLVPLRHAHPPK